MTQQTQFRLVAIPRWAVVLAGIAAAAFAVALLLLSLTVFLVLVPVIALASGLYYLFGGRRPGNRTVKTDRIEIIEGEYRVIEPERVEQSRDPRQS